MTEIIFIYLIATMENIAQPVTTGVEDFKANSTLFYPDWNEETMKYSSVLLANPIIDETTGELREMTEYEKVKAGKRTLDDGSYLDEANKTIVTISKPNEYSVWDKDTNVWAEDKDLKLQYLKSERYSKQKEYVELKKKLSELEDEKTEFEGLDFPTDETEANISEISEKMDNLKKEISALTKEIKKLEKEVM
ncbi:hypothetical protein [Leptotrichia trevisanii]|uniref:hypothetical protein n=1 Tax=Leptotrichia trevisanii TaxID=109328 RepID=UPI0026EBDC96|nr:hypothetical protein [Leptotrichia trevisanii]